MSVHVALMTVAGPGGTGEVFNEANVAYLEELRVVA